jgi:hypothetical protein
MEKGKVVEMKEFKLRKQEPKEASEQIALVKWLNLKGIKSFAIPNGGARHMVEAVALKRAGVSAGVPDLMIPYRRRGMAGLFIEMKRRSGGTVSEAQKGWISFLNGEGYQASVCCGCDEAIRVIMDYMGGKDVC